MTDLQSKIRAAMLLGHEPQLHEVVAACEAYAEERVRPLLNLLAMARPPEHVTFGEKENWIELRRAALADERSRRAE